MTIPCRDRPMMVADKVFGVRSDGCNRMKEMDSPARLAHAPECFGNQSGSGGSTARIEYNPRVDLQGICRHRDRANGADFLLKDPDQIDWLALEVVELVPGRMHEDGGPYPN